MRLYHVQGQRWVEVPDAEAQRALASRAYVPAQDAYLPVVGQGGAVTLIQGADWHAASQQGHRLATPQEYETVRATRAQGAADLGPYGAIQPPAAAQAALAPRTTATSAIDEGAVLDEAQRALQGVADPMRRLAIIQHAYGLVGGARAPAAAAVTPSAPTGAPPPGAPPAPAPTALEADLAEALAREPDPTKRVHLRLAVEKAAVEKAPKLTEYEQKSLGALAAIKLYRDHLQREGGSWLAKGFVRPVSLLTPSGSMEYQLHQLGIENIARVQTGAAISANEEKRFEDLMTRWDTDRQRISNLDAIEQTILPRLGRDARRQWNEQRALLERPDVKATPDATIASFRAISPTAPLTLPR